MDGDLVRRVGPGLPWGVLHTIGVLSTARSITQAAQILRVSQPALSRRVHAAERLAGAALLVRTSSGVTLTPLGGRIAERARHMRSLLRAVVAPSPDGPDRCDFATYVVSLGELVGWFSHRWPTSRWHGGEQVPDVATAALSTGRLDVFIGVHTVHHPEFAPPVHRHVAVRDPLRLAMSVGHRLARCPTLTLADLRDEAWLTSNDPAIEQLLVTACQRHGFHPRIEYRTDRTRSIRDLVAGGRAVTMCVPVARTDAEVIVRAVPGLPALDLVVAWHPARLTAELADHMCQLLRAWYLSRAWPAPSFRSWLDNHHGDVLVCGGTPTDLSGAVPGPADQRRTETDDLDWDDLQAAFETLRTGSVQQAGHRLTCSPSTVQRRMRRLERRMVTPLVTRSPAGHPVLPTMDGYLMLNQLYQVDREARSWHSPADEGPEWSVVGGAVG